MHRAKLTELLKLFLVASAGENFFPGSLSFFDDLFSGHEPAIAFRSITGLQGVLVAVELEVECDSAILGQIRCLGLFFRRISACRIKTPHAANHTKLRTPAGVAF